MYKKSNKLEEIKDINIDYDKLNLSDSIILADALNIQKEIVNAIIKLLKENII